MYVCLSWPSTIGVWLRRHLSGGWVEYSCMSGTIYTTVDFDRDGNTQFSESQAYKDMGLIDHIQEIEPKC